MFSAQDTVERLKLEIKVISPEPKTSTYVVLAFLKSLLFLFIALLPPAIPVDLFTGLQYETSQMKGKSWLAFAEFAAFDGDGAQAGLSIMLVRICVIAWVCS